MFEWKKREIIKWSEYFYEIFDEYMEYEDLADMLFYNMEGMSLASAEKIAAESDRAWGWVNDDDRCQHPSPSHHFFEHMRTFIDELEQKEASDSV